MSGNSFCHKPNESLDSVSLKLNLKKKIKQVKITDYGPKTKENVEISAKMLYYR